MTLIVDYDEQVATWYFVVKEAGDTLHFRPGFRSREDAEHVGDAWIRENFGAVPDDQS